MSDVFISYSRKDKEFVHILHDALEKTQKNTWVDWEDILPTSEWWQEIESAIEGADTFIFVISPDAIISKYCYKEVEHADHLHKRILPIVYRDVIDDAELHPALSRHNWIFFRESDDFDIAFQRLIEAISLDIDYRHAHTRIMIKAIEWNDKGRKDSFLLRGEDLEEAEKWLDASVVKDPEPTQSQVTYIEVSRKIENGKKRRNLYEISGLIFLVLALIASGAAYWWSTYKAGETVNQADLKIKMREAEAVFHEGKYLDALVKSINSVNSANKLEKEGISIWGEYENKKMIEVLRLSQILYSANEKNRFSHDSIVHSVAINDNTQIIATGSDNGQLRLWNINGKELKFDPPLQKHDGAIRSITFSSDGKKIATASDDRTVKLWTTQGKYRDTLSGHNDSVYSVAFSPDGNLIATGSKDNTIKIWGKVKTQWENIKTLKGHSEIVTSVAFNPKNRYIIASGSWDNTVRFWDIENEQEIESYPQKKHRDIVWGVAFSPDGKYVASASKDKTIKLWNLVDGQELKTFEGHTDSVYSVAFSPDKKSKSIVSGSDDNTVKLWDIGDLDAKSNHCPNPTIRENVPQTFTGHTDSVVSVVFSKDGAKIVSASKDGTARIWQRLSQQPYHGNRITSISSDKKNIASAGADCTIKLWNLDGTLKKTLEGHAEIVSRVVFSPDGRYIASASHDRLVILWSAKGERLSTFYDHDLDKDDKNKNAVTSLAFSYYNDSYYNYVTSLALGYYNTKVKKKIIIASADKQGNIKLWYPDEIDKRNRVKGLPILDKPVNTLAFSPDGKYLVSGGDEQTINLWNMETKWKAKIEREPKELASFDRSITSIVFSPDQKSIVVGLDNSTLKLLDFNCPNVIEKAYLKSSCNSTIKLKGESQAFKGHKGSIQQVIFSPDSKLIASASDDKTIKLWNLKGQELQTFLGHSKPVSGIAFSDDKTLVSSSWDRTIRFWYLNYNLDDLLAQGCAWLHDYLVNNPKTSDDDRQMCGIPPREKLKVKSEKE